MAHPQGDLYTFDGVAAGRIGECAVGKMGFGYDPLFYPEGSNKTFGEMSPDEKDALSHRNEALKKLKDHIKSHTY
jgi:XTP/dITP diphosphohydrolase